MFRKNELRCQSQPLPKHRQPLGMLQAFSLAVTTWKKLSSENFASRAAQQRDHVKSNGRNKKYGQLKHDQEISFPLQRICLSLCPFLLAINGQRVFHSNGWINPRPDVMQKKQPGPCIMYGGTEAKRCFCNYMDVSENSGTP